MCSRARYCFSYHPFTGQSTHDCTDWDPVGAEGDCSWSEFSSLSTSLQEPHCKKMNMGDEGALLALGPQPGWVIPAHHSWRQSDAGVMPWLQGSRRELWTWSQREGRLLPECADVTLRESSCVRLSSCSSTHINPTQSHLLGHTLSHAGTHTLSVPVP